MKKNKKNKHSLLTGALIFVGMWIFFKFHMSWPYLVILLITAPIITNIILNSRIEKEPTKKKDEYNSKTKSKKRINTATTKRIPHNRLLKDNEILQLELKDISATELERLCYLYYKAQGFKPELTKKGADGGIDLVYYDPAVGKTAVQIKHYIKSKNQITVEKIRELDSAKKNYGCVFSEFITTSTFTNPALVEAPKSMTTRDIHWFENKIIPWMKHESLKRQKSS